MDKNASHSTVTADNWQRPSLYGENSASRQDSETFSILGGLEPRRYKFALFRRTAWSASLLSLAAVALVVGLNGGFLTNGAIPAPATLPSVEPETVAAPIQPVAAVNPETAEKPEVAAIVTELVSDGADRHVQAAVPSTAGEENKPEEMNTIAAPAQHLPEVAKLGAESATTGAGGKSGLKKEREVVQSSGQKMALASQKPARPKATSVANDKDVDLIAALLTHVTAGTTVRQSPDTSRKSGNAATTTRAATTVPRRERTPGPNRDIVTREPAESMESLVNRCRSLGFFEGELCRLRICSGMWGKDPACPASTPAPSSYAG